MFVKMLGLWRFLETRTYNFYFCSVEKTLFLLPVYYLEPFKPYRTGYSVVN